MPTRRAIARFSPPPVPANRTRAHRGSQRLAAPSAPIRPPARSARTAWDRATPCTPVTSAVLRAPRILHESRGTRRAFAARAQW